MGISRLFLDSPLAMIGIDLNNYLLIFVNYV